MNVHLKALLTHDPETQLSAKARAFAARPKQLFINGEFCDASDGGTFASEDPATGRKICDFASATAQDVDAAVRAAHAAFETGWRDMAPVARAALIFKLADLIADNAEELAQLESLDSGRPLNVTRVLDIPFPVEALRYYAGWATKLSARTIDLSLQSDAYHSFTRREPIGVAALIVPWNFPFVQVAFKLAPALAAGCTVVMKPAEQTPLTTIRLAELVIEAGFPKGVVNILTGFGRPVGSALAEHPMVGKVSFTGSTQVGKSIVQAASGNLKRVGLELGGKSPNIVFADADMDLAIPGAANAIFAGSGQVCVAGSRLFIQRSAFDKVVSGIIDHASRIRIGAGLNRETEIGPLISDVQRRRVSSYVDAGRKAGADVALGGSALGEAGYYYSPTVLVGTTPNMTVQREEIFGPVVCAVPFDDIDDVLPLADHEVYGLASSVWTRDISTAHHIARGLKAGAVWVNCHGVYDPNLPIGGYKQSGWGQELGQAGVEAFTSLKSITFRL
ncbi:aldehyde dehydrogenase family protein [Mesorhizobium sp. DCY119]|uniref:aldehyde dehydrogenase family protein n=1 Tax=Mesorhizobium sp. DCY119 TaxID=2108445 RepID=UPI000E6BED3C|nr:aldehyde dehydrogenase family protein [Mesorhizobium sp. DCY119]RJG46273.1 aldehyde dehydrogenase family protein [Mesorhizobium sp. DCY119]